MASTETPCRTGWRVCRATAITLLAACAMLPVRAAAQTSDTLLTLLEQKGIITADQASSIRQEAKQADAQAATAAFRTQTGLSAWVEGLRLSGDFRGRYESISSAAGNFVDRDRFRYRLRLGALVQLKQNLELGFRFTSDENANGVAGGDPLASNSSFQDNGAKKLLFLDTAFGRWTALRTDSTTAAFTFGKMENPIVLSDLVFDFDYTPEGLAVQATHRLDDRHVLKANAGWFVLDELAGSAADPAYAAGQLRVDSAWSKIWQTSAGVTVMAIDDPGALVNAAVPNGSRGNTRLSGNRFGAGNLAADFTPWVVDVAVTRQLARFPGYAGSFPVRVAFDFIQNPGAADDRDTGYSPSVTLGKAAKAGLWEVTYRFKHLEADAWYEELVDSDTGGIYQQPQPNSGAGAGYAGGTNTRGHIFKGTFALTDSLALGTSVFLTRLIEAYPAGSDSDVQRVQLDLHAKF